VPVPVPEKSHHAAPRAAALVHASCSEAAIEESSAWVLPGSPRRSERLGMPGDIGHGRGYGGPQI